MVQMKRLKQKQNLNITSKWKERRTITRNEYNAILF
jgi:hypothetical protein